MPISMYDTKLQTKVSVYQFGLPDTFGCNTLIWYNGDSPLSSKYPELSNSMWMTINATRLDPTK